MAYRSVSECATTRRRSGFSQIARLRSAVGDMIIVAGCSEPTPTPSLVMRRRLASNAQISGASPGRVVRLTRLSKSPGPSPFWPYDTRNRPAIKSTTWTYGSPAPSASQSVSRRIAICVGLPSERSDATSLPVKATGWNCSWGSETLDTRSGSAVAGAGVVHAATPRATKTGSFRQQPRMSRRTTTPLLRFPPALVHDVVGAVVGVGLDTCPAPASSASLVALKCAAVVARHAAGVRVAVVGTTRPVRRLQCSRWP